MFDIARKSGNYQTSGTLLKVAPVQQHPLLAQRLFPVQGSAAPLKLKPGRDHATRAPRPHHYPGHPPAIPDMPPRPSRNPDMAPRPSRNPDILPVIEETFGIEEDLVCPGTPNLPQ